MKKIILITAATIALAGCGTTTGTPAVVGRDINTGVAAGQLFCAKAATDGPLVVALINAVDSKAITVTNKAAADVALACSVIGGIPVVPPSDPASAPKVAISMPGA